MNYSLCTAYVSCLAHASSSGPSSQFFNLSIRNLYLSSLEILSRNNKARRLGNRHNSISIKS